MTGVEILTTTEVATKYAFGWTWFVVAGSIVALLGTALILWLVNKEEPTGGVVNIIFSIVMGFILGAAVGFLVGTTTCTPAEYETKYKIIISDEVKFTEFLDKYEILDQEGKIYTVKERERINYESSFY